MFARWQEALAGLFLKNGLPEERSKRLAAFVIAAVEGAVIMCRAEESTVPLEAAAAEIHELLAAALPRRPEACHAHRRAALSLPIPPHPGGP
ncbi:LmrA/YxaF family transcription factor, partial [Streptomyces griseorubiginosus]